MKIDLLIKSGEALYGPRWQTELARDLNVTDRTMRRWVSTADDLPPGVALDLWRLCEERAADLTDLSEHLKTASIPR